MASANAGVRQRPRTLGVWPAARPHRLPLILYNTPKFPSHKVTMSAYSHCHHVSRLWTPLHLWPVSVPPVTRSYLSSPSSPIKTKGGHGLSLFQPTGGAPSCTESRANILITAFTASPAPESDHTAAARCVGFCPHLRAFALSAPSARILFLQICTEPPSFPPSGLY